RRAMTREPFDRAGTADPDAKLPLARLLEPAIDEARINASWQHIVAARAPVKRRRIPRWSMALAAAMAGVAIYVAWPAGGAKPGPLVATNAIDVHAGAIVVAPVSLDDGSVVELAPGARLEVLTNEADRFVTLLRHGHARFDVQPGGPRRWEIETSRATVEVVGTAFVLDASEHRVAVVVERGVVVVRGERVPDRVVRLTAGQHLELDDGQTATATTAAAPATPSATSSSATTPGPTTVTSTTTHARGTDTDTDAPRRATTTSKPTRADPVAAMMTDADQHRAAGDPTGAAEILERALATGGNDESTGLVAFTLGRLYLDDLGAPGKAASTFARVIALGAPRSLLEDAYARRIEALVRARQITVARDALADYDRLYPHGVRRAALHAMVK
ncbi:MAG TPA: FecR family protein, partial [Kofleriaceae bacterium]|nr:FecR family protein [Kofleriaceae bacterium]